MPEPSATPSAAAPADPLPQLKASCGAARRAG